MLWTPFSQGDSIDLQDGMLTLKFIARFIDHYGRKGLFA